ncbi:ROK family protein [Candidatus Saccharibacteria bacterium]|nr:MAG: ROK family protein [Candidatus Saccharibacteria bacterium]
MIIAIDTGGTKTLVGRFDAAGKLEDSRVFPTPQEFDKYRQQVVETVAQMRAEQTPDAICIAVPGVVRDGIALECPNLGWKQVDVAGIFAEAYPTSRIIVGNDADIAGIGEVHQLADTPHIAVYVTYSTGIGTGLIVDGKLLPHIERFEAGKIMFDYDGALQSWEQFASGRAIAARYNSYARDIHDPEAWREIADRLSRGLMAIIPMLKPEYIIVGGSVGAYFDRFEAALSDRLRATIPKYIDSTQIIQAKHPEEAVIYGCYHHALDAINDH